MREGDKSVTISTEMASMIVVEYEKHRVAASDAIGVKQAVISAADQMAADYENAINSLALDGFEEESEESYELLRAYRAARGDV